MATTTTLAATVATGAQFIKLTAFTNPSSGGIGPKTLLQFATGERCLVTDVTNSPTLGVVRGYGGTPAAAHTVNEGVFYGLANDSAFTTAPAQQIPQPVLSNNAQEITATGATGSDAAIVTIPAPGFFSVTGASGAGINLPIPVVGAHYEFQNKMTGAFNLYCVGGSINGTTGTTAYAVTTTGNDLAIANCSTAGAWSIAGNT